MSEFVMVLGVIEGPFNPDYDPDTWSLLCTLQTQDGKVSVDEVRAKSFQELYDLRTKVQLNGPQQVEMNWVDS